VGVEDQFGRAYISREGDGRILHDADVEAIPLQDFIDAPPAGAIDEAAVDKNDIVDPGHVRLPTYKKLW
jgi:hypothetical protein